MAKKIENKRMMTPLWIVGSFLSLTEIVASITAIKTTGTVQYYLIGFVCVFPILIAVAFFVTLWTKPFVFYAPTDFGSQQDVGKFVAAMQNKAGAIPSNLTADKKEELADAAQPPQEKTKEQQSTVKPDSKTPNSEPTKELPKTLDELTGDMIAAFYRGDIKSAEEVYLKLIETEKNSSRKREHEAFFHYLRFTQAQDPKAFEDLQKLTHVPDIRSLAFNWIGLIYTKSKDFNKAADAFKEALVSAPPDRFASIVVLLAASYAKDEKFELALETLGLALAQAKRSEDIAQIYEGIADLYESSANMEMKALALEKAVEQKPNDSELRFRTAWAYSTHGLRELALFHYRTALEFNSEMPGALNNLGVEFEHFGMPINAVKKYKAAFQANNTLAAANLAYQYMNAGFSKEAEEILEQARSQTDVHANVGSAWAALSKSKKNEQKALKEIMAKAAREQKYFKAFSEAYFNKCQVDMNFAGVWKSPLGVEFKVDVESGSISASWLQSEDRHILSGKVVNRAAKIELQIKRETQDGGFLGISLLTARKPKGYAYITADGREMQCLLIESKELLFYTFSKTS